jgi:hypothetical protein
VHATSLRPPPLPRTERERLRDVEDDISEIKRWVNETRASIRAWTLALSIAMLGAVGTVIGAAIAYGELRQQAATSERLLTELRSEIGDLRREIHAASR